jgi:hypothetical protein
VDYQECTTRLLSLMPWRESLIEATHLEKSKRKDPRLFQGENQSQKAFYGYFSQVSSQVTLKSKLSKKKSSKEVPLQLNKRSLSKTSLRICTL